MHNTTRNTRVLLFAFEKHIGFHKDYYYFASRLNIQTIYIV